MNRNLTIDPRRVDARVTMSSTLGLMPSLPASAPSCWRNAIAAVISTPTLSTISGIVAFASPRRRATMRSIRDRGTISGSPRGSLMSRPACSAKPEVEDGDGPRSGYAARGPRRDVACRPVAALQLILFPDVLVERPFRRHGLRGVGFTDSMVRSVLDHSEERRVVGATLA